VVINEVAWAGTAASQYGEWFELYNAGSGTVALDGWALYKVKTDGTMVKVVALSGNIAAGEYVVVERSTASSPDPITDIASREPLAFGDSGLSNGYEHLALLDPSGTAVDDTALCATAQGTPKWCGGSASPAYASMERIDPDASGADPANWGTNDGVTMVGSDASGGPIRGTPGYANSVTEGP
jgi:hypothetical protein